MHGGGDMTVYLLMDAWRKEVFAVFSSEEKARKWLETKAVQEGGWTPLLPASIPTPEHP